MPSNDNWEAVHTCDFCGNAQFVIIDNLKDGQTNILCARCGVPHLEIELDD